MEDLIYLYHSHKCVIVSHRVRIFFHMRPDATIQGAREACVQGVESFLVLLDFVTRDDGHLQQSDSHRTLTGPDVQ